MRAFPALFRRNCRLFFKDKGMFFTSLITPVILLVLFVTFLGNVYRSSFESMLPFFFHVEDALLNGIVGGQLVSSLLAVSCVTVSFCANLLMVQDKANGTRRDLTIAPVSGGVLALSYFAASFTSAVMICLLALGAGLAYLAATGWYLSAIDVALLVGDVVMMTLFGTALSSVIGHFLSTQGQMSAVGTIVSSGYGFLCGAYMPISQFGEGLQKLLACLPGTYGTVLLHDHAMRGALNQLTEGGVPDSALKLIRDALDCNLYFFDQQVSEAALWTLPLASIVVLTGVFVLLNRGKKA